MNSRGDVFVSDATTGEVLALTAGSAELSVYLPAGRLRSPQGLAFSDDEKQLFVADYGSGVWRIETATREATPVSHPANLSLLGVDGLVYRKGGLIAVQNGVAPNRVVRLDLTPALDAVRSSRILEMSHPQFDEPTLGTLTEKEFFYVANSQWSRFEKDGTIFPPNRLAEPVILKLKLD